ncbi:MAG TPA: endonuclease/exonuclease/phosphatase family protein [Actinomycetota bacterium]
MGAALLAVICVVSLQVLRVFFPIVFDGFEDAGYVAAGAVTVGIPALGSILGSSFREVIGDRRSVLLGVGLLAAGRIALQAAGPIPFWLVAITTAAAFWALMSIVATGGFAGRAPRPVQGLLLGFAVDLAIRSVFHGWDPVWQEGVLPWVVAVALPLGAMTLAIVTSRTVRSDGSSTSWVPLVAIGPFLFLHAVFLQNVPFVASRSGVTSLQAVAVILALDAATIFVVGAWPRWQIPLAVMAAVGMVGLRLGPGAGVLTLFALATAGTAAMLVLALRSSAGGGRVSRLLAHAGGPALLGALVVAYQKPRPLPLPGGYLLEAATITLLLLAWVGSRSPPGRLAPLGRRAAFGATLLVGVPLGLWLSTPAPATRSTSAPREIRLLDYNVHSAVNDGQVDLEALASTIEAQRPSIVVLQEAGRGWPVTGMTDVVEWLSWRLRMPYRFGPAGDGPYGNTIMYRPTLRVLATERGSLPQGGGLHPRSYLSVTFAQDPLRVVATHLDGEEDDGTRLIQIDALLRAIDDADGTVVAGDLNAEIGSPELAKFQDFGFVTVQDLTGEWAATFPEEGEIFDHILIGSHLTATDVAVGRTDVSDHFPVVATIRRR